MVEQSGCNAAGHHQRGRRPDKRTQNGEREVSNKREIIEENILWKFIISTDVLADVYFWHHDDPLSPTRRKNSGLTRCQRITWFEVDLQPSRICFIGYFEQIL